MATKQQALGKRGEAAVHDHVACPRCRRVYHLTPLPVNLQCADMICKFCGFLAQVKAVTVRGPDLPERVLGAAWGPQHEQIMAGIYHSMFVARYDATARLLSIDYVPAHILAATPSVFEPRPRLSATARRSGWQGFYYNLGRLPAVGSNGSIPHCPCPHDGPKAQPRPSPRNASRSDRPGLQGLILSVEGQAC